MAIKEQSDSFLTWLEQDFLSGLPPFQWQEPSRTAILVIDLVRGFCNLGPLASPRVNALVPPVAKFLQTARQQGVAQVLFCCDEHPPNSPEFQAFPPHCVAGTEECDLHPELAQLNWGRRIAKGSLNAFLETEALETIQANPQLRRFIVVGDCTDLCCYQAAMHLRLLANTQGLDWEVIVLADLVDTYDLPLAVAQSIGAMPHPGDLCHLLGLYQLALNGCKVQRYSSISA